MIRAVLGGDVDYDLEWIEARGGTRSSLDTPLWRALEEWVARGRAGREARRRSRAPASPTATGCARRSAPSRTASSPSTGELPAEVAASLIHSADERIPVADLELGVRWLRHAATLRPRPETTLRARWRRRRSGSAAWRCRTACSCTGRTRGRARSGTTTGGSRSRPRASACRRRRIENPLLRGPARLAEALLLLPQIKAKLPAARLPMESPRVLALDARRRGRRARACASRGSGRSRRSCSPASRRSRRRCSRSAPASSPRTTAPSTSRSAATSTGSARTREHERCGGHLVGPLARHVRRRQRARGARAGAGAPAGAGRRRRSARSPPRPSSSAG